MRRGTAPGVRAVAPTPRDETVSGVAAVWAGTGGEREESVSGLAAGGTRSPRSPRRHQPGGRALVLGDPSSRLADALAERGLGVTRWHRFLHAGQLCTPWPPPGPFREVWVRLPRSAREAAMLLHAAAARIGDGGRVFLFGAKDEGIRSAARHFPEGTGPPKTVFVKKRSRVLAALRRASPPLPDGLKAWQIKATIDWGDGPRRWTYYPGVFACGRLDAASALLVECLPVVGPGLRALDFGAGTGVLAAALIERNGVPARVVMFEPDAVALEAAVSNVPLGTPLLAYDLEDSGGPFDLIVSNPPVHAGKDRSLDTVEVLAGGAPGVLAEGGLLLVVVQRQFRVEPLLNAAFRSVRSLADSGPFRVWAAEKPR